MVMLDEAGGKPLTGYGSGANSGEPVASPEESAAMLASAASTLKSDLNGMCRQGGAYEFAGAFCQTAIREIWVLRFRAAVISQRPSLRRPFDYATGCLGGGLAGAEALPAPPLTTFGVLGGCAAGMAAVYFGVETDPVEQPFTTVQVRGPNSPTSAKPKPRPGTIASANRRARPHGRQLTVPSAGRWRR